MYGLGIARILIALVGAFLLSIEAIKIENIAHLRERIERLPNKVWIAASTIAIVALIVCAIGTIFGFLLRGPVEIIALTFFGNHGYDRVEFWLLSATLGTLIVAAIVLLIAYAISLVVDQVVRMFVFIEQRTFTGIFGIVGFLLTFLAAVIELGIYLIEHAHPADGVHP
jgi:hypothetical protein